jgi:prevent-host-death family protein
MRQIAFAEIKDHLSKYLVEAGEEQIVITKHGKPAGVLTGFATEDDWFDFRLENDPRFLRKIEESRASVRAGRGVSWDQVKREDDARGGVPKTRYLPRRS